MSNAEIKALLTSRNPEFWSRLAVLTGDASDFDELFQLSTLRKKAHARQVPQPKSARKKLRLAIIGGYNFYPLRELVEHMGEMEGSPYELWVGDYDNYISEIMDEGSALYEFKPDAVLLMPSGQRCKISRQADRFPRDAGRGGDTNC